MADTAAGLSAKAGGRWQARRRRDDRGPIIPWQHVRAVRPGCSDRRKDGQSGRRIVTHIVKIAGFQFRHARHFRPADPIDPVGLPARQPMGRGKAAVELKSENLAACDCGDILDVVGRFVKPRLDRSARAKHPCARNLVHLDPSVRVKAPEIQAPTFGIIRTGDRGQISGRGNPVAAAIRGRETELQTALGGEAYQRCQLANGGRRPAKANTGRLVLARNATLCVTRRLGGRGQQCGSAEQTAARHPRSEHFSAPYQLRWAQLATASGRQQWVPGSPFKGQRRSVHIPPRPRAVGRQRPAEGERAGAHCEGDREAQRRRHGKRQAGDVGQHEARGSRQRRGDVDLAPQ